MIKHAIVFVLAAAVATGCKKDEEKAGQGTGTGTGKGTGGTSTVAPPAPATRPSQGPLPQLPKLELAEDARRADKIALGQALWHDPRLSVDGSLACYSCHKNEDGNGGHDPLAIGPGGKPLPRHSPVIWNVAFLKNAFYWDGRSPTLEAQAKAAWAGGNMGVGEDKLAAKTDEIAKIPGYKALFEAAFPGEKPTPDHVTQAMAEYERTLLCTETRYDKFAAGDKTALSEVEQRGLDLFMGKAQCTVCHTPPFFSSAMNVEGGVYYNVGVGTDKPEAEVDVGRMKVTNAPADWAAFKPPSLRNVTKSAPYFHNGSVASLDEAVKIMSSGGIKNKNLTPVLTDRGLLDAERADLVAFLAALECGAIELPAKLP
jgi:cytochrome c peroxidase